MSDVPPVPEAATPPYPAHPEPTADKAKPAPKGKAAAKAAKAAKTAAADKPDAKSNTRKYAAAGAAIGIGSAAIVAALLFTNRNKKS